jgi:peptidoglycan-N-acetylglucosamine deacetylase
MRDVTKVRAFVGVVDTYAFSGAQGDGKDMNVPTSVLLVPSRSRMRRHGCSPLVSLATVCLALVLGVLAVVLLQGETAQAQRLGSTSQPAAGIVRLTFDDGPVRANTPRVLDVLNKYRVKATFFVIGQRARRYPRLVKREYREGHSVQNHTYTHPELTALSPVEIRRELRATNRAIKAAGVPRPYRFRPPRGHTNARVRSVGASLGLIQTLWSVDPHDWASPPASEICRRVVTNVRAGSIVLLHDGSGSNTVEALPCIIKKLRAQGYGFGKL